MNWIVNIPFLIIHCLTWTILPAMPRINQDLQNTAINKQASVQGKYDNLLHVIKVPDDKANYGLFYEWGYWAGDSYANHIDLSPGFWVYVYPNWYIWQSLAAEKNLDPQASVNGKYSVLLHVLYVPEDESQYNEFYDWGFSEQYSYAGYDNLTPGYWVYLEPNWYVWAQANNIQGGT